MSNSTKAYLNEDNIPETAVIDHWKGKGFIDGSDYNIRWWIEDIQAAIQATQPRPGTQHNVVLRLSQAISSPGITPRLRLRLLQRLLSELDIDREDQGPRASAHRDRVFLVCEAIFQTDLELVFVTKHRLAYNGCFATAIVPQGWRSGPSLVVVDFVQGSNLSVFSDAAAKGHLQFVTKAVARLEELINSEQTAWRGDALLRILSLADEENPTTALDLAVDARHRDLVAYLLQKAPELKQTGIKKVVSYNTTEQSLEILDLFLDGPPGLTNPGEVLKWTISGEHPGVPKTTSVVDRRMARRIHDSFQGNIFNATHATSILKWDECDDFESWWKDFEDLVRQLPEKHDLLVLAIQQCRLSAVECLLHCQPSLLVPENDATLPLKHNVPQIGLRTESSDIREEISKLAVKSIVSELHTNIPRIREILTVCNVPVKEICLDLSGFPVATKDFSDYADQLGRLSASQGFEETLAYVKLPDLDSFHRSQNSRRFKPSEPNKGIDRVLEWLDTRMGVRKIVRLEVLDDWETPYEEEYIAKWTRQFRVEVLKWRRKDMSVTHLTDATMLERDVRELPLQIRELHLYGSSLNIALAQWSRPETFAGMPRLERVVFHSAEGRISPGREKKLRERIRRIVEIPPPPPVMNGNMLPDTRTTFSLETTPRSWRKAALTANPLINPESQTPKIPQLEALLEGYDSLSRTAQNDQRIKVAIIDNGVDRITLKPESKLAQALDRGKHVSFVSGPEGERPWWLAEEPHGTWMANLITAIDPRCDLYIARVCTGLVDDINFHSVTQAIEWATRQQVDIISMSFALYPPPQHYQDAKSLQDKLTVAVNKANAANIVMVCSTSDTGRNSRDTWPVRLSGETIGIAGCDYLGNLLPRSSPEHAQWYLPGSNVDVGRVPFLTNESIISGSSAATAIAAGLASLTLSCHVYNQNAELSRPRWKKETVQQRFRRMTSGAPEKYVQLEKFCCDRQLKAHDDIRECIQNDFGGR